MVAISPCYVRMVNRVDRGFLVGQVDAVGLLATDMIDVILRVAKRGQHRIVAVQVRSLIVEEGNVVSSSCRMSVPDVNQIRDGSRCHNGRNSDARIHYLDPELCLVDQNFGVAAVSVVVDNDSNPEIAVLLTARVVIPDAFQSLVDATAVIRSDVVVVAENLRPLSVDVGDLVIYWALGVSKRGRWSVLVGILDLLDGQSLLLPQIELERVGLAGRSPVSVVRDRDASNLSAEAGLLKYNVMALVSHLNRELVIDDLMQRLLDF